MENLTERARFDAEWGARAAKTAVLAVNPAESTRYLHPSRMTPYALEYAFYLIGDVDGKRVLDLGCGSGEKTAWLCRRGAHLVGIDVSSELVALAEQRLRRSGLAAELKVGSAYALEIADESVDVIFCASVIHHLNITAAVSEMRRVLKPGGAIVLKEPIRFSEAYARLRNLLPTRRDVSKYEHPLTRSEFASITEAFTCDGLRYFRLPWIGIARRISSSLEKQASRIDEMILGAFPLLSRFATVVVVRLTKSA
jgi:SAM-dependent methyltransferase